MTLGHFILQVCDSLFKFLPLDGSANVKSKYVLGGSLGHLRDTKVSRHTGLYVAPTSELIYEEERKQAFQVERDRLRFAPWYTREI